MMVARAEPSTEEVRVARPPSVFVRAQPGGGGKLRRVSRKSNVFALRQRAQIVLPSDSGVAGPQIA
jgi:hypothetical protein